METILSINAQYFFIAFLIFISAIFSSSETALTALSKAKIRKLRKQGNKRAKMVSDLRKDKELLISSILIGNNISNILASVIATALFMQVFSENAVFYASLTMTIIVIIFAEVIPKSYAIYNAEKLSLLMAPIIRLFCFLLTPFAKLLRILINFIFKTNKNKKSNSEILSSALDELRSVIDLNHKEGLIIKEDKDMLDSIIDLSEIDVGAIMTHRKNLFTINVDNKNNFIVESMLKSPYTRVPIWKDTKDNIIGIIHAKELLKAQIYSTKEFEKLDITKIAMEPWFIPETTSLKDQLFAFRSKRNHFAIVVDEYGSVLGVVTLEDILEEIVGEIKDEHDKGALSPYRKTGKNSYIAEGHATIRDLNRDFDFELPEDDASTIAGLMINIIGKIPDRGDICMFNNIEFKLIEKRRNQLIKIALVIRNNIDSKSEL